MEINSAFGVQRGLLFLEFESYLVEGVLASEST